jgi:transmembrane sensor
MKTSNTIRYDLLARHLAGETNEQEQLEVFTWLKKDIANSSLYQEISSDWEKVKIMKEMNQFNVDSGWDKLKDRIAAAPGGSAKMKQEKRRANLFLSGSPFLRIAAAIALLVMAGLSSYWGVSAIKQTSARTIATSGTDHQTRVVLPDGSTVFLNSNTKITYSKHFNKGLREVRLMGEAYFDVKHNTGQPFIIYTGKAGIKVLGTSFNVQAYKSSGQIEVYVESGKVELFETENTRNSITIEPGFIGSMNNIEVNKQRNTNSNYLAWKTKKLYFNNTDLATVAKGIQDVFKVQLIFDNPGMTTCKYTGKFENNETLDIVLETICTVYNTKWERKDDTVILSGPGC